MDLKIVGWTDYDSDYPSIEITNDEIGAVLDVVIQEITKNGYMFSGEEHQNSLTGVPVFDNGTCLRASMRSWGTIMSFAYPEIDKEPTNYMSFYMSTPGDTVMPKYESIDVEPSDSKNFNGMITKQDGEMISQSLQMGMQFMTTDKVLNAIMDAYPQADEDTEDEE